MSVYHSGYYLSHSSCVCLNVFARTIIVGSFHVFADISVLDSLLLFIVCFSFSLVFFVFQQCGLTSFQLGCSFETNNVELHVTTNQMKPT